MLKDGEEPTREENLKKRELLIGYHPILVQLILVDLLLYLLATATPMARSTASVRTRTSGHLRRLAVPVLGAGTWPQAIPRCTGTTPIRLAVFRCGVSGIRLFDYFPSPVEVS